MAVIDVRDWVERGDLLVDLGLVVDRLVQIEDVQRRAIAKWLAENLIHAFDVTHAGVTKSLGGAAAEPLKVLGTSSPRDLINALSSTALAPRFEGRLARRLS